MPYADQDDDWGKPTRNFLYGPDKTKKTWWACRAAEAGFNVLLIDGDNGGSITDQLTMGARKRILKVDAFDTLDRSVFTFFMGTFLKGEPFIWDEQGKISLPINHKLNPEHSHIYFDVKKFTTNDVVIPDSWTRLASSTMFQWARENNIDLTAVEREGDQFSLMNYQSRFLDYCLGKLGALPCHVIGIGHETVYEKFEKDPNNPKKQIRTEQRTQPFSSTGPHAKKIGAHFSNILRFQKLSDLMFQIDAGGGPNTMGGCRQLEPKKYNWKDISPATIFEKVGFKGNPEQKMLGAIWMKPGMTYQDLLGQRSVSTKPPDAPAVPAQAPVVDAGSAKPKVSLLGKLGKT